jgi:hypothetical protein
MAIRHTRRGSPQPARGRGPQAGHFTGLNRLCGAVIAVAAVLASVVAIAAPAAASGPPGTITSATGNVSLSGSFAGVKSSGVFKFHAMYPTWVAATAIDDVSGTIKPSSAVDTALANLGASRCILWASSFKVTVDNANPSPQTLDVGYQAGPMTSALPLSFQLPQLSIGQLMAPATGNNNMTTWLTSISGTVHCFTSSGAPVTTNNTVGYTAIQRKNWLAQTSFGTAPLPGKVKGTVTDNNSPANPVAGASVSVCTIGYQCTPTTTAANGTYSVSVPPGQYIVVAAPPTSITNLDRGDAGPVTVASSTTTTGNVVLDVSQPLPAGVSMPTNTGNLPTVPPTEYWKDPFKITVSGCPNGTATWQVQGWNIYTAATQTDTGPMTETPTGSGNYTATIPPLDPIHGPVVITITINCPNGTTQTITIDAYIDPSGTVVNQDGAPISGASVTLYDSSSLSGPWSKVPNGDTAIMSPSNTMNPDTTGAMGQWGWDTVAGFYRLKATAPGCTADTTAGFTVAPPRTGVTLTLTCNDTGSGPAWTVSPGGDFTGKSGTVKITDTKTGVTFGCHSSNITGTLNEGSGLNGPGIGSITGLSLSACTGPAGSVTVTPNALPLALNAVSYKGGATSSTIGGIDATLSGKGCSAMMDGTTAKSANGQVGATYNNKQGQLAVLPSGGNLTLYNVSGCLGLMNNSDRVTVSATYKLSPAQQITGP